MTSSRAGARQRRTSRRPQGARRWFLAAGTFLTLANIVVAPELLGGATGWTIFAIASLAAAAAISCSAARTHAGTSRVSVASAAMVLPLAWTGLQALPLPCDWTAWVLPEAADAARRSAALVGSNLGWCALSTDVGRTQEELVKGLAIVCSFLCATVLCRAGKRTQVIKAVAASAVLMAAVALAHKLAGATSVFGLYAPIHASSMFLAPLMNANTLGGFLAMGAPVLLGLGLETHGRTRTMWLLAASIVTATVLGTLSRGAIGATAFAGVMFAASVGLRRHQFSHLRASQTFPLIVLAVGAGAGIGLYVGADTLLRHVLPGLTDTSKLAMAWDGLNVALEHPWTGVGRGGFSTAFVERMGVSERFEYPENIIVQWTSEWGFPVAIALAVGLGAPIASAWRTVRSPVRAGALVGVLAIAVQNFVDLGLETCGVAVVAAALLGAALAPSTSATAPRDSQAPARLLTLPRLGHCLAAIGAATAIAVATLGPTLEANTPMQLQAHLEAQLGRADAATFKTTLRRAVMLHPREPAFALLAGVEASRRRDDHALRWLNRAMELAPGWPSPHIATAHWLHGRGRYDQALLEVREAAARAPGAAADTACTWLRRAPDASRALRAAPREQGRREFLDALSSCLNGVSPATSAQIDSVLMREYPNGAAALLREAARLIDAKDATRATTLARRAVKLAPDYTAGHLVLADALIAGGDVEAALRALHAAERTAEDVAVVLRKRAWAEARAGRAADVRETIAELRGMSRGSAELLAEAARLLGALEEEQGNFGRAMRAYEEEAEFVPAEAAYERLAAAADKAGDRARYDQARRQLCAHVEPDDPRCRGREPSRVFAP